MVQTYKNSNNVTFKSTSSFTLRSFPHYLQNLPHKVLIRGRYLVEYGSPAVRLLTLILDDSRCWSAYLTIRILELSECLYHWRKRAMIIQDAHVRSEIRGLIPS